MDRTYHAWQTLRELGPTPRAKRAKRRGFAFAVLCAVTLGYLLAVAPWAALVFFVGLLTWIAISQ